MNELTQDFVSQNVQTDDNQDDNQDHSLVKGNIEIPKDNSNNPPSLTRRDYQSLKKSKYSDVFKKYDKSFVLKNKKTGAIAEIRGVNAFHACKFIGWKPQQVKVLSEVSKYQEKNLKKENEINETIGTSSSDEIIKNT